MVSDIAKQNNGFGPIPKLRRKDKRNVIYGELGVIAVSVLILTVYRLISSTDGQYFSSSDGNVFAAIFCAMMLSAIIRRCCLFAEEYKHIDGRYLGSWKKAFQSCISLSVGRTEICLIFVISVACTINSCISGGYTYPVGIHLMISLLISIGVKLWGFSHLTKVEISDTSECDTHNISVGLAWNYYFGYLKIILPLFPNMFQEAKGKEFRVGSTDICDKVTDKRLFIVIPKDGYCYKKLDEVDSRIKLLQSMPEQKSCRGGVKERRYKNSLYEVKVAGKLVKYAVIEYATPLLSMYDMSRYAKVDFKEEHKGQQAVEFYKKLKEILKNYPECDHCCQLVLTGPGATSSDPDSRKLADILWDEIK